MIKVTRKLVVYTIKPDYITDYCHRLLKEFREQIIQLPGCLAYETLSDTDNQDVFADIVTWASMQQARNAEQIIHHKKQHSTQDCFKMFDEIMLFKYFSPLSDWCNFDLVAHQEPFEQQPVKLTG